MKKPMTKRMARMKAKRVLPAAIFSQLTNWFDQGDGWKLCHVYSHSNGVASGTTWEEALQVLLSKHESGVLATAVADAVEEAGIVDALGHLAGGLP